MIAQAKAVWWLAVLAAGFFGAFFNDSEWYKLLNKPWWSPPPWVFGIVWTILYIMQATAMMLTQFDTEGLDGAWSIALTLYCVWLGVSTLFMPAFFWLRSFWLGMAVMIASMGLSIATSVLIYNDSLIGFILFLFTTLWVSFATLLFLSISVMSIEEFDETKNIKQKAKKAISKQKNRLRLPTK